MITKKQREEIQNLSPAQQKRIKSKIKKAKRMPDSKIDNEIILSDLDTHNNELAESGEKEIALGYVSEHVLSVFQHVMEDKSFIIAATPRQVLARANKLLKPFERIPLQLFDRYISNPDRVMAENFESIDVLIAFVGMLEEYNLETDSHLVSTMIESNDWKAHYTLLKVRNPTKFDVTNKVEIVDNPKKDKQETERAEMLIGKYEVVGNENE